MRITFITSPSENIEPYIPIFESKGIVVDKNQMHPKCDAIIGSGHTGHGYRLMDTFNKMLPQVPLINLTLDFYKTVWIYSNPHNYDWKFYKKVLHRCDELWCIADEVILRLGEEGLDTDKCKLMKIWSRFFDYDGEIKDKRYILNPVRAYPYDKNYGWLKRACGELQIPLFETKNRVPEKEFQKIIAECSFMCTEYHEISTGGLTLLEGYNLGKVSVVSDSQYEGVRNYLGDRAIYFDDNSYDDFKRVLKETWENTPQPDLEDCRAFCAAHPTIEDNVDFMIERLNILKSKQNNKGT
tara:strand:- start:589 stop:1479 length:891 start_codon:yes stop_codon:yes gene_type:complete